MTHRAILTKSGAATIPAEIRKQLGLKPGMYVRFVRDERTGGYSIVRPEAMTAGVAGRRSAAKPTAGPVRLGLLQLADLGITGGPSDLAQRADEYLYGGEDD